MRLLRVKNKFKTFESFANEVRNILLYCFASKFQYEVVITSWPLHISSENVDRLKEDKNKLIKGHGHCYNIEVDLDASAKVDIYTQVMLNWDNFINYLWNNKKLITKAKLGLK